MRLYIANCTHQRQTVFYRTEVNGSGVYDERRARAGIRQVTIMPRQQVSLPDFEHIKQGQNIMDQLARVGGVGVEEVSNRLPRKRLAYVMSLDKPVPKDKLLACFNHNRSLALAAGRKQREAAAIAANEAVDRMVREATQDSVRNVTVEFEENPRHLIGDEDTPVKKRIAEGFDIVKDGEDPGERKRTRAARRRVDEARGADA